MKLIGNQTNSKNSFSRHIIIKLSKNQRQINSLKCSKRKEAYNLQCNPYEAISKFISRNFIDQERVDMIYSKY